MDKKEISDVVKEAISESSLTTDAEEETTIRFPKWVNEQDPQVVEIEYCSNTCSDADLRDPYNKITLLEEEKSTGFLLKLNTTSHTVKGDVYSHTDYEGIGTDLELVGLVENICRGLGWSEIAWLDLKPDLAALNGYEDTGEYFLKPLQK